MVASQHIPTGEIGEFVDRILILKSHSESSRIFFPDTSIIFSLAFGCPHHYELHNKIVEMPVVSLSGIRNGRKLFHVGKNSDTLLVKFKAGAAAMFFPMSMHHCFQTSVPLTKLYPKRYIKKLWKDLASQQSDEGRLHCLQSFLFSIFNHKKYDPLIYAAVEKVLFYDGNLKIQDLCIELSISLDAFEKRFRKVVGASPKQFCSIVRMKRAISIVGDQKTSLTDVAFELGYFDQTHFIRAFKNFTGQTPSAYFKNGTPQS